MTAGSPTPPAATSDSTRGSTPDRGSSRRPDIGSGVVSGLIIFHSLSFSSLNYCLRQLTPAGRGVRRMTELLVVRSELERAAGRLRPAPTRSARSPGRCSRRSAGSGPRSATPPSPTGSRPCGAAGRASWACSPTTSPAPPAASRPPPPSTAPPTARPCPRPPRTPADHQPSTGRPGPGPASPPGPGSPLRALLPVPRWPGPGGLASRGCRLGVPRSGR
jgi:hypothetical protein